MLMTNFSSLLGFTPNTDQITALKSLTDFVNSKNDVFILKGSAGTGKTSITKAITAHLALQNINFKIGAPTGRATMIIGAKTGQQARTMHSHIYTPERLKHGGGIRLNRKQNQEQAFTVFIVDEASMVSNVLTNNENFFVKKPLLEDYIDFVKQGNQSNKIIFIGDRFQLPPVKSDFSPALNASYLEKRFNLKSDEFELTKVMRQSENSDILSIATTIRDKMKLGYSNSKVLLDEENSSWWAMQRYLGLFDANSLNKIAIICSTNRDVNYWNRMVRKNLGLAKSKLTKQDFVVTQSTWMDDNGEWVSRGEFGKVKKIDNSTRKYAELHFKDAVIEFPTSNGAFKEIKTKVLMDSLNTQDGMLEPEKEKHLYAQVMKHNSKFRESQNNADDKYLGALRLRHGYATTCHKAQGGEWQNVLVHPYKVGKDLQWTYTAITRAKNNVFSYVA